MGRFRSGYVLVLLVLIAVTVLRSNIYITPANSQPISPGVIGAPGSNNPKPNERIASYRLIWYGDNRSGSLVFRTVANQEHSLSQLDADQLHSLVQILQTEAVYFERQNQILYTAMKRTME